MQTRKKTKLRKRRGGAAELRSATKLMAVSNIVSKPTVTITHLAKTFYSDYHVDRMIKKEDSMSYSAVGFGTQTKTAMPVAFKFFVEYTPAPQITEYAEANEQCAKMKYEQLVYQAITRASVNNTVTFVAAVRLDYSLAKNNLSAETLNALQLVIPSALVSYIKYIHVTIMERRPMADSFDHILSKIALSTNALQLKSLLWQIVFTLAVLTQHQIQHNDLHYGNILVDQKPVESSITYSLPTTGQKYKVDVGKYGKVLLFDWDFSYSAASGHNVSLDNYYCQQSGICNSVNPRFDLFTILYYIESTDVAFNEFKKAVRGSVPLYENFQGRMCNINPRIPEIPVKKMKRGFRYTIKALGNTSWPACGLKSTVSPHVNDTFLSSATASCKGTGTVYRKKEIKCVPYPLNEPHTVLTPLQALAHPYFDALKI
jgi:hypothetical protein